MAERCGEGKRSVSSHGDGDRQRIKAEIGRCKLSIDFKGEIEFLDDESGVERMPRGTYLEIEEKFEGVKRYVEFRPGQNGQPEIVYELDGKSASFDAEAQEWVAIMIPQLFRMTGYQAEERVARILSQRGVDAVLEEVRLIGGDYVQRTYMVHLMDQADMSSAETLCWLKTAG